MAMPKRPKARGQAFYPVAGFLLILAGSVIAFLTTPFAYQFMDQNIRGFPPPGVPVSQLQVIIGVMIFFIVVLLVALIVAAAMPRKKSDVNEKMMGKEREQMVKDKKIRKLRQQQINKQGRS
jgi:uncharacterized membrane protein YhaH (DUF805 family)